MPFRICKTVEIENGHMLSKHPDKCRFPHGHTRKVEIILEADHLDENEMVCDFKVVKEAVGEFIETLDHSMCMNTADPKYAEMKGWFGDRIIGFKNQDPTTEMIAKLVYDNVVERFAVYASGPAKRYPLRRQVRVMKVRVWETSSSWAEYEA